mmetsp:Transcript_44766/g.124478  ORF Transcript_44766/g.124478 Transcript_44766/m.124478 type:complete len:223 (-) Transcript_44766:886-1554(-)
MASPLMHSTTARLAAPLVEPLQELPAAILQLAVISGAIHQSWDAVVGDEQDGVHPSRLQEGSDSLLRRLHDWRAHVERGVDADLDAATHAHPLQVLVHEPVTLAYQLDPGCAVDVNDCGDLLLCKRLRPHALHHVAVSVVGAVARSRLEVPHRLRRLQGHHRGDGPHPLPQLHPRVEHFQGLRVHRVREDRAVAKRARADLCGALEDAHDTIVRNDVRHEVS